MYNKIYIISWKSIMKFSLWDIIVVIIIIKIRVMKSRNQTFFNIKEYVIYIFISKMNGDVIKHESLSI